MTIDPARPETLKQGRIDPARMDAATERDIAAHQAEDETEAKRDAAPPARRRTY